MLAIAAKVTESWFRTSNLDLHILAQFPFPVGEIELDCYHQKMDVRAASRLKTEDLSK